MYFGEPLALSVFGFFNAVTASVLYIFGNYGYGSGVVAVFASVYCMCRLLVIYQYFSAWENKEIHHLRAARQEIKSKIANTGGVDQIGSKQASRQPTRATAESQQSVPLSAERQQI